MKTRYSNKWAACVVMVAFMTAVFLMPPNANARWRSNSGPKADSGGSNSKALVAIGTIGVVVGLIYYYVGGQETKKQEEDQQIGRWTPKSEPVSIASLLDQLSEKKLEFTTVFPNSDKRKSFSENHQAFNPGQRSLQENDPLNHPRLASLGPNLKFEFQTLKK